MLICKARKGKSGMGIGEKIREARKSKGLTQKQLGDLCGMADSAIRRYESGRGNPTEKTMRRIANALDLPESYFWARSPFSSLYEASSEYKMAQEKEKAEPHIHGVIEAIFGKKRVFEIHDDENFFLETFFSFGEGDDPLGLDEEDIYSIEDAVYTLVKSLTGSYMMRKSDFVAWWESWFQSKEAENIRKRAKERDGVLDAVDPKENE